MATLRVNTNSPSAEQLAPSPTSPAKGGGFAAVRGGFDYPTLSSAFFYPISGSRGPTTDEVELQASSVIREGRKVGESFFISKEFTRNNLCYKTPRNRRHNSVTETSRFVSHSPKSVCEELVDLHKNFSMEVDRSESCRPDNPLAKFLAEQS